MPDARSVSIKVFLLDWADVPRPAGYTRTWVEQLFFATSAPRMTPDSHGDPLDESALQYFHAETDGRVSIHGTVSDWVTSRLASREVPHYIDSMTRPGTEQPPGSRVDHGESWPVVIAETLRGRGFVLEAYRDVEALHQAIRALPDGSLADVLVFLHTDVGGGGAKRQFTGDHKGNGRVAIAAMSEDNVRYRTVPGSDKPWSSLWDEGWEGLPECLVVPFVSAERVPTRSNGTFAPPAPTEPDLRMYPFSVVLHELGHLVLDLPDTYQRPYDPWGDQCLMGGPNQRTHHHVPFGSYARSVAGDLVFDDRPYGRHRIHLRPYETHNLAVRLPNGPAEQEEYLVLTNRLQRSYQRFAPPVDTGRGAFIYRLDPHYRTRMIRRGVPVAKVTAPVRSGDGQGHSALLWRPGDRMRDMPPMSQSFDGPATLRNGRGELWYTLARVGTDDPDLLVDLNAHAIDLVQDFHRAAWTGFTPRRLPQDLRPDRSAGPRGHARHNEHGLRLHPASAPHGLISGSYPLDPAFAGQAWTLQARFAMDPGQRNTDGVIVELASGRQRHSLTLLPGDVQDVRLHFAQPGSHLEVRVGARADPAKDVVVVRHGWIVPAAPVVADLLASAAEATWSSQVGAIDFGRLNLFRGHVRALRDQRIHTGIVVLGNALFTTANPSKDGFIQGLWSDLPIPAQAVWLRGSLAWPAVNRVRNKDVLISVLWRPSGKGPWMTLAEDMPYTLSDRGRRSEMNLELLLPPGARDATVDLAVRVGVGGSAASDGVVWTRLALTTA